jgi:sugar phosphate isomerase/epimerase
MRRPNPGESILPGVKARVQVNAPFGMLWDRYLPLFLARGLNPEIGLDAASLDRFSHRDFSRVAAEFHQAGRQITLHAPFQDILPGALDAKILAASRARLQQAFALLEIFQPRSIVCHIGYESRHYHGFKERWLANSVATWEPLADKAARWGALLTLENVYETQPDLIQELFARLPAPNIRMCLDVGHLQAFGGGDFQGWLHELGSLVGQLHLHDNRGADDEHLALGQGVIPLKQILAFFAPRLEPSLAYLQANWPWSEN